MGDWWLVRVGMGLLRCLLGDATTWWLVGTKVGLFVCVDIMLTGYSGQASIWERLHSIDSVLEHFWLNTR